jgi:hypothetical protein
MNPGDHFINKATKRVAIVVATSLTHVEYHYDSLKRIRGSGKRVTKPNTACLLRSRFRSSFKKVLR